MQISGLNSSSSIDSTLTAMANKSAVLSPSSASSSSQIKDSITISQEALTLSRSGAGDKDHDGDSA